VKSLSYFESKKEGSRCGVWELKKKLISGEENYDLWDYPKVSEIAYFWEDSDHKIHCAVEQGSKNRAAGVVWTSSRWR